jgi:hypothetical protein
VSLRKLLLRWRVLMLPEDVLKKSGKRKREKNDDSL